MRLAGIFERVFLINGNFHRAGANLVKQVFGGREQVFALGDVIVERGSRGKKRTFGLKDIDVERLNRARRRAEADEIAERPQAIERGRKCRLTDAVIDDIAERTTGDVFDPRDKVFIAIKNRMMTAVLFRELGLSLSTRRCPSHWRRDNWPIDRR